MFNFSILWFLLYIVLNVIIFMMLQSYVKDNKAPSPIFAIVASVVAYFVIKLYPQPVPGSKDVMFDFMAFAVACLIPFSQLAIISTKFIAELLINNDDFDPDSRRNYLSEIKLPLDNLTVSGKYDEALEFLLEKQLMKKFAKDYRICIEIATIAMVPLGDVKLALENYSKVLTLTKKAEPVAYSLYRMADIYIQKPETRADARFCLTQLVERFPNNEYGRSAQLRLKVMDQEDSGEAFNLFGDSDEVESAASSGSSNLLDMTSEMSIEETAKRLLDDGGASQPQGEIAPSGNSGTDYQKLLQESAARTGRKAATNRIDSSDMPERRSVRPDAGSLPGMPERPNPLAGMMPASVAPKTAPRAPEGSYQSLLDQSVQKTAVKKSRSGKTGHLNDLRLKRDSAARDISRPDIRPDTGSLRKASSGIIIPGVMSDSEAYQMMLRKQGVQTIGGSQSLMPQSPAQQRSLPVNVQEDGITGFTRLKRTRKAKP